MFTKQALKRLVLSPSEEDMRDTRKARLRFQEAARKTLNQSEASIANTYTSSARERGLQTQIEVLMDATESVRIENFQMKLGHVLATSGFRVAKSGCAVDWELIEVDENRVAGDFVSPLWSKSLQQPWEVH